MLVICTWISFLQSSPTAVDASKWLLVLEGTWVLENARGAEVDIVLTVAREGSALVLKTGLGSRETATRYDLTGADLTNANFGRKATFRTRIVGQKMVTEIWEKEPAGPPETIETRYLERLTAWSPNSPRRPEEKSSTVRFSVGSLDRGAA